MTKVAKHQNFLWQNEQVFFPTTNVAEISSFFCFFELSSGLDPSALVAILESGRPIEKSFEAYFLSLVSRVDESEKEFETRKRDLVVFSSDLGYPPAEFARYKYLHDGEFGFEKDLGQALVWLQRASNQGHVRAQEITSLL